MSMNQVERIELAPGFSISRVLTGLWQVADLERGGTELDAEVAAAALAPYVDAGFTAFDMADHYGTSEIIAGTYRRTAESGDVQLLTKWVPKPGPVTRDGVREAVQRSLDRMQADRLDMLQFHAWSYPDPGWLDCMFHLQELQDEGLIRHLGVTNFDTAHLRMVLHSGVEVLSNQISYSLLDGRAAAGMSELCTEHGVKILAFGTVAGGFLSERWLGAEEPAMDRLETWSQMKYKRFIDAAGGWEPYQALLQVVAEVAAKHGVSVANVASRFMLDEPAVGGVIIGARLGASEHIEDNLRLFGLSLDDEDREAIAGAQAGLRSIPGDCGDEYRRPPFLTAAGDLSDHFDGFLPPYPTEAGSDGRTKALSGTIWEDLAGFSRAVRKGDRILVSGTTATHGDRIIGGVDPEAQAHFCIDKLEGAIQSLGGRLEDVVRTRIYIRNESDWEPVSRAHGQRFREIQPANTLVKAGIIGDGYLVEMEAEAVVGEG